MRGETLLPDVGWVVTDPYVRRVSIVTAATRPFTTVHAPAVRRVGVHVLDGAVRGAAHDPVWRCGAQLLVSSITELAKSPERLRS